jgi:PAS domain S-box-containing protein
MTRFVLPDDLGVYSRHCQQVLHLLPTDTPLECELRMTREGGAMLWVRLGASVWHGADGAPVCRIVLTDITRRKQEERELQQAGKELRFETLLAELSARFINVPADRVDAEIEAAQRRICESLGLDLCALWQWEADALGGFTLTHHYRRLDGPPISRQLQAAESFPWVLREVLAGRSVLLASTDNVPPGAERDQKMFRHFGLKNVLIIPLSEGHKAPFGGISFHDMVTPRTWSEPLLRRLALVAETFANALLRKRAEQTLRESEARYRGIYDGALEGMFRTSPEGRILAANPALASMLGYGSAEDVVREIQDTAQQVWAEAEERARYVRRLEAEGVVRAYECQFKRQDGTRIWVSLSTRAVRGPDGRVLHLDGFVEDIGERKRAAQVLADSESRFRAAFMTGNDAYLTTERDTDRMTEVNDRMVELYGYTRDEFIGHTSYELGMWVYPEARQRMLEQLRRDGRVQNLEVFARRKGGEPFWVLYSVSELENEGTPLILGVIHDITDRRRSEEALERSRWLQAETAKMGKVGGWELDIDTGKQTWTEETCNIHEMDALRQPTMEEATGFFTPASASAIQRAMRGSIEHGEPFDLELEIVTAQGNPRNVHVIGKPNLEQRRVYGFIQDITERKLTECRLRQSEERLRQAAEAAEFGVYRYDLRGGEAYYSREFMALYGLPPDATLELGPDRVPKAVHADDRASFVAASERSTDPHGSGIFEVEFRVLGADGKMRWLRARGQTSFDSDGDARRPVHASGVLQDITKRKQEEETLRQSESRLAAAIDVAGLGFYEAVGSTDHLVTVPDKRVREVAGIPPDCPDDGIRAFWLAHVHPHDVQIVLDRVRAFNEVGGPDHVAAEYRYRHEGRGLVWIRQVVHALARDATGRVVRMLGVLQDITEQKTAEQELGLQRLQLAHVSRVAAMGQLTSSLAHELNQPLGAILRNAEAAEMILQDPSPDLDEVRAILADIRRDDQRAGAVIDRMRDLMKRREVKMAPLDAGLLAAEVIGLVRPEADSRRVELALEIAPALPSVQGDRVQLQQVVLNLLLNAMDALGDSRMSKSQVAVRVRPAGAAVEVSVSDNGHGIPADRLPRIFEPFYTSKPNGLGMGLPISRVIVEAHGGRLRAENSTEGGARFTFTLPAAGE